MTLRKVLLLSFVNSEMKLEGREVKITNSHICLAGIAGWRSPTMSHSQVCALKYFIQISQIKIIPNVGNRGHVTRS